jgi:hypothetical protein
MLRISNPPGEFAGPAVGTIGRGGNFCPILFRGLTIPAQAPWSIGGPTTASGGVARDGHLQRRRAGAAAQHSSHAAPATARKTAGSIYGLNGTAAAGLRAISTVDALIALQGIEDFRERKKRAVTKGRNAVDVLDQLKLGFHDGTVGQGMLARLKVATDGLNEGSGDAGLDAVLGEIDLRVAAELAKAGIR